MGCGHAGDETSVVRPITPGNAVPGLYSLSVKAFLSAAVGSTTAEGEGFGSPADQSTSFKVEKSIFSSGTLSLGGNVGQTLDAPAVLRAAYSHQFADGERPQVAVTVRRLQAQTMGAEHAALQALALTLSDQVRLADFAEFLRRPGEFKLLGNGQIQFWDRWR